MLSAAAVVAFVTALVVWDASPRAERIFVRFVPARATTRLVLLPVVLFPVALGIVADVGVARAVPDVAARADVFPVVALRADVRDTTRRGADNCSVFVMTFMGFEPCSGVTPGFRSVRIWLFRYGYI